MKKSTPKFWLGIDVGGSYTKFALIDQKSRLVDFWQRLTPKSKAGLIKLLSEGAQGLKKLQGLGVGLPGLIDSHKGLAVKISKLGIHNLKLAKILKQKTGLKTKIDNDANCFVFAESLIGAAKKHNFIIGLTLGTGLGGGIVINKKIFRGRAFAGELGHQIIDYKNNLNLERFIGGKYLKLTGKDFQSLAKQAREGQIKALNFWKKIGSMLAYGCANIIYSFDPEIIVIGGKLTLNYSLFYPSLKKTLDKLLTFKPPKIVKAKFIDQAGAIGAALIAKNSKSPLRSPR